MGFKESLLLLLLTAAAGSAADMLEALDQGLPGIPWGATQAQVLAARADQPTGVLHSDEGLVLIMYGANTLYGFTQDRLCHVRSGEVLDGFLLRRSRPWKADPVSPFGSGLRTGMTFDAVRQVLGDHLPEKPASSILVDTDRLSLRLRFLETNKGWHLVMLRIDARASTLGEPDLAEELGLSQASLVRSSAVNPELEWAFLQDLGVDITVVEEKPPMPPVIKQDLAWVARTVGIPWGSDLATAFKWRRPEGIIRGREGSVLLTYGRHRHLLFRQGVLVQCLVADLLHSSPWKMMHRSSPGDFIQHLGPGFDLNGPWPAENRPLRESRFQGAESSEHQIRLHLTGHLNQAGIESYIVGKLWLTPR